MRPAQPGLPRPGLAMLSAIAAALALLLVLLVAGWGQRAWGLAAGLLVAACLAACAWAALIGERASREVRRETERFIDERRRKADGAAS